MLILPRRTLQVFSLRRLLSNRGGRYAHTLSEPKSPSDTLLEIGNRLVASLGEEEARYKTLRDIALLLVLAFSIILGLSVGFTVPQNAAFVGQAGQSLIEVDGFLAAASGVIAFFYSARLLEFASPSSPLMMAMRPVINAEADAAAKELGQSILAIGAKLNLSNTSSAEDIAQGQKVFFDTLGAAFRRIWRATGKVVRQSASPARRMSGYAAFVLIALLVSAYFSILAILGGSVPYLGTAFGFTVLGSGTLALAWSDAHVNLIRFLISSQAHESMRNSLGTNLPSNTK